MCTKSFVGWGFAPDPTGGAYSTPPDPLAGLGGGATGEGKEGGEGKRRRGRVSEGVPECPNPELASLTLTYTCKSLQQAHKHKPSPFTLTLLTY